MGEREITAQKAQAERNRDRLNWLMLGCILLTVVPAAAVIAFGVFPNIKEKYIFGVGLLLGVVMAYLLQWWLKRREKLPACPACGHIWEIIESGPTKNSEHFEEKGSCPKCGVPI